MAFQTKTFYAILNKNKIYEILIWLQSDLESKAQFFSQELAKKVATAVFTLKSPVGFKIAEKGQKFLGYFLGKIWHQKLS